MTLHNPTTAGGKTEARSTGLSSSDYSDNHPSCSPNFAIGLLFSRPMAFQPMPLSRRPLLFDFQCNLGRMFRTSPGQREIREAATRAKAIPTDHRPVRLVE